MPYCDPRISGVIREHSEERKLFYEVDYLVTYIIVIWDDKTAIGAVQRMKHQNGEHKTVTLVL